MSPSRAASRPSKVRSLYQYGIHTCFGNGPLSRYLVNDFFMDATIVMMILFVSVRFW
jgi:hypothetical protein